MVETNEGGGVFTIALVTIWEGRGAGKGRQKKGEASDLNARLQE